MNLGPALGFDLGLDLGLDILSLSFGDGIISSNKFSPSRFWYNINMGMPSLIDNTPAPEYLGCSPISRYSSRGCKCKAEDSQLDCILDR